MHSDDTDKSVAKLAAHAIVECAQSPLTWPYFVEINPCEFNADGVATGANCSVRVPIWVGFTKEDCVSDDCGKTVIHGVPIADSFGVYVLSIHPASDGTSVVVRGMYSALLDFREVGFHKFSEVVS